MATETAPPEIALGMPVEVSAINRELKKLWEDGGEVMTRASLVNLAVYSEAPDSLARNTQIISAITKDHACRALVIAAHCSCANDGVQAWISAHCHVSRAGSKQVCSEQLSFLLEGSFAKLLPNIVFSHLDSDLPFYLWWQGDLPDEIDPQFWTWVDRLIYDSREWRDFNAQMQRVEAAHGEASQRVVLCDLNWTRIVFLRLALAQFFDGRNGPQQLADITRIEIDHAPGYRSTAILLLGWLAAQLRWNANVPNESNQLSFTTAAGKQIAVGVSEEPGQPIGRCSLFSGKTEFRVSHAAEADLLDVSVLTNGTEHMHQLMPAGSNDPVRLVSEELMRGGPHHVYLRAVERVRRFL
jgi:glucose-6-phosphate dehydrogenase assembly protein OpcA